MLDYRNELERSTGQIFVVSATSTEPLGTGFCISPSGYVLTAGHLFTNCKPDNIFQIVFQGMDPLPLMVASSQYDRATGKDLAICKASAPSPLPYLSLRFPKTCSGPMSERGYPTVIGEQSTANGQFLGIINVAGSSANRLFHFESDQAGAPGFSGSAVYSIKEGGVVALQTEAAEAKVGPQWNSVLAFPLFHISDQLDQLPAATRWSWWFRSRIRALFSNSVQVAIVTVSLFFIVATCVVTGQRMLSFNQMMTAFSDPNFDKLDTAETAFWLSAAGQNFLDKHKEADGSFSKDIYPFMEQHPDNLKNVLELANIYEKASDCFLGSLCFDGQVCVALYPRIWNFYHQYQGVWSGIEKKMNNRVDVNMERFLRDVCDGERNQLCRDVGNASSICH
ncbi:serine protease [Mesorhizobium sp. M0998]|uniref:S1 family peptidase n=1 Tax=Mesorhizobium sp. M0998 TaxID=2957044 RepID=UPI00333A6C22